MSEATEQKEVEPGGRTPGTCADYCRLTGLSLNSVRAAIAAGEIQAIRIGRRILIPGAEFDKLAGRPGKNEERIDTSNLERSE